MSNQLPNQAPAGNDDVQFVMNARNLFIRWCQTDGHGYHVTVALIPRQVARPGQSDIIPGWMHALITHLVAVAYHDVPIPAADYPVNPVHIQQMLLDHYHLIVPQDIIVALVFEFLRYPADLQHAWFTVTVQLPSMFVIDDRWRALERDRFNPNNPEDVRLEMARSLQLTLAPAHQPSVSPIPLPPPRPQVGRDEPRQRSKAPVPHPVPVQPQDNPSPQPPPQSQSQNQTASQSLSQSQGNESDNSDSFTRQPGGRLRRITRHISYALAIPRRRNSTTTAAAAAATPTTPLTTHTPQNQNDNTHRRSSRSASPPRANDLATVRQRTPQPLQRSITVTGASLSRRISNTLRGVGGSIRRSRRDGNSNNSNNNPTMSPTNNDQSALPDRDRSIGDILADTGLNTAHRHTQPPRNTVFQDGSYRLHGPSPNAHRFPTSPTALSFNGDSDGEEQVGRPGLVIDQSDAARVGSLRAQAPRPSTAGQLPTLPTDNTNAAPIPVSHRSPRLLPLHLQSNPNTPSSPTLPTLPSAPAFPPPRVSLPAAWQLPGNPHTLTGDSTPAQVNYFMWDWQRGEHVPDVVPGHAFTCTIPGCESRTSTKRSMRQHYVNHHGMAAWQVPDLNQRLPVPARRLAAGGERLGRLILVDSHGNDLPGETTRRIRRHNVARDHAGGAGGDGADNDNGGEGGDNDEAA